MPVSRYPYHNESKVNGFFKDLKYLYKSDCNKECKFVIFGRGRSGSTLLVSLLNTLPDVYCDGEIFNVVSVFPKARVKRACNYSENRLYGFKLLSYQLFRYNESFQLKFLNYLSSKGFRLIYLKRENLLNHAISNIRAREYGFHNKESVNNEVSKVNIDMDDLFYWLELSEFRENKEEALLTSIYHKKLVYERDLENPENHKSTIDEVCDFLEIARGKVATQYRKVSPEKLIDSVLNYEEIRGFLRDTRFEKYLTS